MGRLQFVHPAQREVDGEAIKLFQLTLKNAFEQFQKKRRRAMGIDGSVIGANKLWNNNLELVQKYKESQSSLVDVQSKLGKAIQDSNISCPNCTQVQKSSDNTSNLNFVPRNSENLPDKNESKTNIDRVDKSLNSGIEDCVPEIFSQDFSSEMFESFSRFESPPREVRSPVLPRSPVLGGKKSKTRNLNSSTTSNSEMSVTMLDDALEGNVPKTRMPKSSISCSSQNSITMLDHPKGGCTPEFESSKILKSPCFISEKELFTAVRNDCSTGSPSGNPSNKKISSKVDVKKCVISTMQNVKTDILFGKNMKLKQSKLVFKRVPKVTDVSLCDDYDDDLDESVVNDSLSGDIQMYSLDWNEKKTKVPKLIMSTSTAGSSGVMQVKKKAEQMNGSCLEDDVIQATQTHKTASSKMRNKLSLKSKSVSTDSFDKFLHNSDHILKDKSNIQTDADNIFCDTDTHTDITFFMSEGNSAQYKSVPSTSVILPREKASLPYSANKLTDKLNLTGIANAACDVSMGMDTFFLPDGEQTEFDSENLLSGTLLAQKSNFHKSEIPKVKIDSKEEHNSNICVENTNTDIFFIQNKKSAGFENSIPNKENLTKSCVRSPTKKLKLNTTKRENSKKNNTAHCTFGDETYFSPAETTVDWTDSSDNEALGMVTLPDREKHKSPPREKLLKCFDVVSRNKPAGPKYAYKSSPVRKKSERAKLNGWSCWECKNYFEGLDLDDNELQIRKNECSRHRAKYDEWNHTPQGVWSPGFPNIADTCPWSDQ